MGSTQDVYAANLRLGQYHGYPLHSPVPSDPENEQLYNRGFQIGDVGSVNSNGKFTPLFNIGFPLPAKHRSTCGAPSYEPVDFVQPLCKSATLPEGHIFMTGVRRVVDPSKYARSIGVDVSNNLTYY